MFQAALLFKPGEHDANRRIAGRTRQAGANVLGGSVMSGVTFWAVAGPVIALAGVTLTAIGLRADQAQGKVIIEDGVVQLRDVRGRTADGTMETSADLNFRATPSRMQFNVSAKRVNVQRLPSSWSATTISCGIPTIRIPMELSLGESNRC